MVESDKTTTVRLAVHSTPFAGDTPFAPAFYEAIGRVVVLWGRFETNFDGDLLMYTNIARRYGIERQMQFSLARKTKLLRQLFRDVPVFQPYLSDIRRLACDIDDASKDRNLLLHSHVGAFRAGDAPVLELENHRHEADQFIISKASVTLADLESLASIIDNLNTRLIPFSWNLNRYQDEAGGKAQPPIRAASD